MSSKNDVSELEEFAKKLANPDAVVDKIANEIMNDFGAFVLRRTKDRTPRDTSTLIRNWKVSKTEKKGNSYSKTLYNNVGYAPYVEYGHRTRGPHNPDNPHKTTERNGWVPGFFMATRAFEDLEGLAEGIISKNVQMYSDELFT